MGICSSSTWSYDLLTLLGGGGKELLLSWWRCAKRFAAERAVAREHSHAVTSASVDFCRYVVIHHLLQKSLQVNRGPASTGQADPPVHCLPPVIAVRESSGVSTKGHWETAPAIVQIPSIASSATLANCFDAVGMGIDKGVGGFAPPSSQPPSPHHQVTVGIWVIGSGFGEINVAVCKTSVICGFSVVHQQNPQKNKQLEEQPGDGHDGKSGSAEEDQREEKKGKGKRKEEKKREEKRGELRNCKYKSESTSIHFMEPYHFNEALKHIVMVF